MAHWEASGQSDEWYTPKLVFDALQCVFDLDVAAPATGPLHVPARAWLSERSLESRWHGFVWMNPPFGSRNSLAHWLNKFFAYGNGIALTPDRTSAAWFQAAWPKADAVLFTPKLRFLRPDGSEGKSPSNGILATPHPHATPSDDADRLRGVGCFHDQPSTSQVQQDHV